ncbi:uncharacterized protein LOC118735500 [Rhagoletis pomonella]|uniref:uncharacterized protein LOC118735500 n=1 Tax=Rhagoletis pomonella TaxID=28610 RepID=UPI001785FC09|nr:uncharacterized protein LOC118735500 [Rhagoletis pomonella]
MWYSYSKDITYLCLGNIILVHMLFMQMGKCEPPKICPIYCICNLKNNLNHADCSSKYLISANTAVPYQVESLDLSYNDITVLDNASFQGYVHLKNLTLGHNAIHTIFLDTFVPLKRIRAIDLSYNRLEFIDPRLFESNRKIDTLNLEGNKFFSLANEPFLRSKSLQTLNLASAQINVLLPVHYRALPQLQAIDLTRNHIITIDKFATQAPKQLRTLNLEENNLNCDQTLRTAIDQLKVQNVEVIYSYCQNADTLTTIKGAQNKKQEFERIEIMNERLIDGLASMEKEEDAGDSQEHFDDAIRRGVLSGWHSTLDSGEDVDYYADFDMYESEEKDFSELMNKTCRRWCYQNGCSKSFPRQTFNNANFGTEYSDLDFLLVFICGNVVGIAITVLIGSCIICIWRCTSLKARNMMQVEDPYGSRFAVARQSLISPQPALSTAVDAIRRPSAQASEPEQENIPVVLPQPPRRRRQPSRQRTVVRYDQLARTGGGNFISQLFGRPARHQYYRTINENTANLIRRLSRSNLFNNRLSQHFGDRESSATNSSSNAPDSPDGASVPSATRTPHRRRPETPPPLYSEVVPKSTV